LFASPCTPPARGGRRASGSLEPGDDEEQEAERDAERGQQRDADELAEPRRGLREHVANRRLGVAVVVQAAHDLDEAALQQRDPGDAQHECEQQAGLALAGRRERLDQVHRAEHQRAQQHRAAEEPLVQRPGLLEDGVCVELDRADAAVGGDFAHVLTIGYRVTILSLSLSERPRLRTW
jgi:hypothetical protein